MPQRSFEIADTVWKFLEECWSRDHSKRPSAVQVYGTFSQFSSLPRVSSTSEGRSAAEELPGKLKLQVQSIKISLNKTEQQHFSIKFEYWKEYHMTLPTTEVAAGDEHTWSEFRPFIPSLPLLSLEQEPPERMVDRNQQGASRTTCHCQSAPPDKNWERQGLRDREIFRKSATTTWFPT